MHGRKNWIYAVIIVGAAIYMLFVRAWQVNANIPIGLRTPMQSVTSNGLEASLMQVNVDEGFVEADVCVSLPSNEDWQPEARLISDAGDIFPELVELHNSKDPETFSGSYRCYRFSFPNAEGSLTNARIVIDQLKTSFPMRLDAEKCSLASEALRSIHSQFAFRCEIGDHGGVLEIIEKPVGMSEEQAVQLAFDSLVKTVTGPWVFSINP